MTRVSTSAEALGDFAIHANHRGAALSVNLLTLVRTVCALSLFPNDVAHRISGIGNHLFDPGITERLSRFRRNGYEFFREVDLDAGHFRLLSKCLFDAGGAKRADHSVDGGPDSFP